MPRAIARDFPGNKIRKKKYWDTVSGIAVKKKRSEGLAALASGLTERSMLDGFSQH